MKYNEKIREIGIENGWTQERVCKELEKYNYYISRSAYAKYESGQRQLSVLTLEKLAWCFNVSADYILGLVDNKQI